MAATNVKERQLRNLSNRFIDLAISIRRAAASVGRGSNAFTQSDCAHRWRELKQAAGQHLSVAVWKLVLVLMLAVVASAAAWWLENSAGYAE